MQAITGTLKQEITGPRIEWSRLMKAPLSWLTRVFGCWHREMSRPLTLRAGESYRVCLECGARRRFDPQTWEMAGPFYYAQPAPLAELYRDSTAVVKRARAREDRRAALRAA
jgi:hypothetical protein